MAGLEGTSVTLNVVDERVQTAIHILEASSLHGLSDADGISDLRGQAVKFLTATLAEWNGEKLAIDVQVYLGGDLQFQRWHTGDSQGGICPAKKDAAAVIRALEEALDNARRITCLDFQTAWDGAPIPGEPLPFEAERPAESDAGSVPRNQSRTTGVQLVGGDPVPADGSHTELKPNGQQAGYVVLTPEERAKGFERPVRTRYIHVGAHGPKNPLRDLTPDEHDRYDKFAYVKFEAYPEPRESPSVIGRYWTQAQLDAVGTGCGQVTTINREIAETYARNPNFYGATFCCGCGKHLPVGKEGEFVWEGTQERVGT